MSHLREIGNLRDGFDVGRIRIRIRNKRNNENEDDEVAAGAPESKSCGKFR